jgi:DNA-directed RNA polymerase subunit RPC12/RpoP
MENGQRNITNFLGKRGRPSLDDPSSSNTLDSISDTDWRCSDCSHRISTEEERLDLLVQEHQDYHLALQLSQPPEPKRVKKDIRAFFTKPG